jgi:hypothetical protein
MEYTSALLNKKIKQLQEEKEFILSQENSSKTYVAAQGEEPVIPEYDYVETSGKLEEIDEKILNYKHALNVANSTHTILVNGKEMTIDQALIKMSQLNKRKFQLDQMRKVLPKRRVMDYYGSKKETEFECINYDLDVVKKDYDFVSKTIVDIQLALDEFNQLVKFEV